MNDVVISVGTILSVSLGAPATYDEAGFSAKVYIDVGEITDIPALGGSAQVATHAPLATGIIDKLVGSIDYGEASIPMAAVWSDAGQMALKAGFDGINARKVHSIKIHNPAVGTLYFTSKISGVQYTFGDANTVFNNSVNVAITGKVLEFASTSSHVVSYLAGPNGSIIGPSVQFVADGSNSSPAFAAAAAGYEFDQWSDGSTDNPRRDIGVTGDLTVTAAFQLE